MEFDQDRDAGRRWPTEKETFTDPRTGATVHRLTDARAHDNHVYFAYPGWCDDDTLLFLSERTGRRQLFSVDVESGAITQLTDLDASVGSPRLARDGSRAFLRHRGHVVSLDLETLAVEEIVVIPDDERITDYDVTADDGVVAMTLQGEGKQGRVAKVSTDGDGTLETLHTLDPEAEWSRIDHLNASPTQPALATFCYDGDWATVENRIWGIDLDTGEAWEIRPREGEESDERIGHEFWLPNGEEIGYHGHTPSPGRDPIFGVIRPDNTDHMEAQVPFHSKHFCARSRGVAVGDGDLGWRYVYLYRFEDGEFDEARRLAHHGGTWHTQSLHVHPRFTPDGDGVVYTANPSGYGNVYLVEIPEEFGALPAAAEEKGRTAFVLRDDVSFV